MISSKPSVNLSMGDITVPYPSVEYIDGPVGKVAYPPNRDQYFFSHNRFCMIGNRLLFVGGSWYGGIVSATNLLPEDAEHIHSVLEECGSNLSEKDVTLTKAIQFNRYQSVQNSGTFDHPCKTVGVIGSWIQAFGPIPSGIVGYCSKIVPVRPFSE